MSIKTPPAKASRIAAMIGERAAKAEEAAKSVAKKTNESAVKSVNPALNTVKAAIEIAGLTDLQISGIDKDGLVTIQATIPEAVIGEYLIFEYRSTSPVLIVKGLNEQLPSIPVEAKNLSDLIADVAVSYFESRIAIVKESTPELMPESNSDVSPPNGKPTVAATTN